MVTHMTIKIAALSSLIRSMVMEVTNIYIASKGM